MRASDRDRLQLLVRYFDIATLADHVAPDDVLIIDSLASNGIDLAIFDSMPSLLVELMKPDLLPLRSGGEYLDRTGYQGEAQGPFPIGTQGHRYQTPFCC